MNTLISTDNVTAYGFQAFVDLAKNSNQSGEKIVISTLSPAVMAEEGIMEYYAPVLPRGAVFNTADDVEDADLDVNLVATTWVTDADSKNAIIVSRHAGTIDVLKEMYPDATVLSGNVTTDDIAGKFVAGTLPPTLVQHCAAYQAVTINNFDYRVDGDLHGCELQDRLHICNPISIEIS